MTTCGKTGVIENTAFLLPIQLLCLFISLSSYFNALYRSPNQVRYQILATLTHNADNLEPQLGECLDCSKQVINFAGFGNADGTETLFRRKEPSCICSMVVF